MSPSSSSLSFQLPTRRCLPVFPFLPDFHPLSPNFRPLFPGFIHRPCTPGFPPLCPRLPHPPCFPYFCPVVSTDYGMSPTMLLFKSYMSHSTLIKSKVRSKWLPWCHSKSFSAHSFSTRQRCSRDQKPFVQPVGFHSRQSSRHYAVTS